MNIRHQIGFLSHFISEKRLVKVTGRSTILPFYHAVSDVHLPHISNLYPLKSVSDFKKEVGYLSAHFTPVDIDEVHAQIQNKKKPLKPVFHLSFDDGLREVYDIIAPILEKKGVPATFFVNTEFIDNKKLFYRYKVALILERLKTINEEQLASVRTILAGHLKWQQTMQRSLMHLNYHDTKLIEEIANELELDFKDWLLKNTPYLTSEQVRDLKRRGFTIGSHSAEHPKFKDINLTEQKEQIVRSFTFLKEHFNIEDRYFSFPFGDEAVRSDLFDWMYSEGKCKLSFGVSGIKDDYCPQHMHRIPMDECLIEPQKFIKTEYVYFILKSLFNKNKIRRK